MQNAQILNSSLNYEFKQQTMTITHMQQAIEQLGLVGLCGGNKKMHFDAMQGSWSCRFQEDGVSMHCGAVTELEDFGTTVELPPGISLNILFAGEVMFALSGNRHFLGQHYKPVECTAFTLNRPEMLTRFLQKGQFVKKVNIFVRKSWLDSRLRSEGAYKQLQKLFQHHALVKCWNPSDPIRQLALAVLNSNPQTSLSDSLRVEGETLRLLSVCLSELCEISETKVGKSETCVSRGKPLPRSENLPRKLRDILAEPGLSLEQIASSCNMSVSTLQRRFRAAYGMTVSDYIRTMRLEKARTAMVCDGLSIGEAAYLAGYHHTSNFVAAFKKNFSMTPAAYRKSHQSLHPAKLAV